MKRPCQACTIDQEIADALGDESLHGTERSVVLADLYADASRTTHTCPKKEATR